MVDDPELRRLLWYLLGAIRGGENRAKIIRVLRERPSNINQVSTRLQMDYRLVEHHMNVLRRNSMVISEGEHYGKVYFLSPWLESHFEIFEELVKRLNLKLD